MRDGHRPERRLAIEHTEHERVPESRDAAAAEDVHRLRLGEREIVLVGTAHVSRESTALVREVIESEKPDHVCVELDAERYEALAQRARWESLDLRQILRRRQVATLLANLLLGSYQKKIGRTLGVLPGAELLEAVQAAEQAGVPFTLADRQVRVTMLRAWRSMSFFQKAKLLGAVSAGLIGGGEISEQDLRELRQKDVLSELMRELAATLPSLKRVLIDERDAYLAEKIRAAPGRRIVAVVGAGHVEGIREALATGASVDLEGLTTIPPASAVGKWIGWGIPALLFVAVGAIGWTKGLSAAEQNLRYWVLAHGIPSAIGAILALAHPLTVVAAFVAAPITSLSPVIGAGYVTAFVQTWMRPPRVRDFEAAMEEAGRLRCWWTNRLLRVLLAFLLPTLGSMLGTYLGAYRILSDLW